VATLKGHSRSVLSVAFDPKGTILATGSCDNTAKLYSFSPNGSAATCVATLEGHSRTVRSVAFDPKGTILATVSNDETVKLWR
jgi:WD40 repeat protein